MCLDSIDNINEKPDPTIGWGYKVFSRSASGGPELYGHLYGTNIIRPLDKWLLAKTGRRIRAVEPRSYRAGWHVFATIEAAKTWGDPVLVAFRGVTSVGRQDGYKVYVANEIFIPSKQKQFKLK
jgi:hypothetical protein